MSKALHTIVIGTALLANLAIPQHWTVLPACCQSHAQVLTACHGHGCSSHAFHKRQACCEAAEVKLRPSETINATAAPQTQSPTPAKDLLPPLGPSLALAAPAGISPPAAVAAAPPSVRDLLARHARLNL